MAAAAAPPFAPGGSANTSAKKRRRLRPPRAARKAAERRATSLLNAANAYAAPWATIRAALPAWEALGASPWCLRTIRHGLYIPWTQPPPPQIQDAYVLSPKDAEFSNNTVDAWCASGSVTEATPAQAAKLKHLAPSFVVHKGKDRLVVDLSERNAFIDDRRFVYEHLPGLVKQLVPDDHLVSWDIKDAFHHICLLPADRLRLAF